LQKLTYVFVVCVDLKINGEWILWTESSLRMSAAYFKAQSIRPLGETKEKICSREDDPTN
jgi:hypothetical protein